MIADDPAYQPLRIILTLFPDLFRSGEDDQETEPAPFHLPEVFFADSRQEPLVNHGNTGIRIGQDMAERRFRVCGGHHELPGARQTETVARIVRGYEDQVFHITSSPPRSSRSISGQCTSRLKLRACTEQRQR